MFEYDESSELWIADLDNVIITCDELRDGYEEQALKIAENYASRLDEITDFLIKSGISDAFGEMTADELKDSLGVPQINIGNRTVSYTDHALDDSHIISFEYADSDLGSFMYLSIDG